MEQERQRPAHGHFDVIHTDTAMLADVYLAGDDPSQSWALADHVTGDRARTLETRRAPIG